ncbi:MAG TPA: coproporphyrinogen dehydrogenase HemZ [Clostridiaceae bacterium]|nr:coproporphyrinogen dehydrogenase HemZ [Clostridiaceae bacterium]
MFFKNDKIVLIKEDFDNYIGNIGHVNNTHIDCTNNINIADNTDALVKFSTGGKVANYYIQIEKDGNRIVDLSIPRDNLLSIEDLTVVKKELARQIYSILSKNTGKKMPWGMLTGVRPAKIPYEMMEKGMTEVEIISELQNYYFVSPKKASLAYTIAKTEKSILERNTRDMVSLYIGIPFCKSRCHYCSFTSNCIDKNAYLVRKYTDALKREIQMINEDILKREKLKIQTIYIGGGTPTSVSNEELADLLQFIENTLDLSNLEEYTLEAGRPDTIDREKLITIKNSKVSRISINPQTMNLETLKAIGRSHTPEEVKEAFYLARDIGINNINMDIIVGLPGETLSMFEHTLKEIRQMNPENLTVHALSIKRASKLREELDTLDKHDKHKNNSHLKDVRLNKNETDNENYAYDKGNSECANIWESRLFVADETANAMVDMAYNYALSMGMNPYYMYRQKNIAGNLENVGYSKPGFECIYNIQIMEEKQTIIAFGAGAVTKVVYPEENRIERAFNVKNLENYITRIDEMIERKKNIWTQSGRM